MEIVKNKLKKMIEKYKPILNNNIVSVYQKGEKTLILGKKEITLQTNEKN